MLARTKRKDNDENGYIKEVYAYFTYGLRALAEKSLATSRPRHRITNDDIRKQAQSVPR
jgi:hypothetical protein